jgi:hypothetical protein
MHIPFHFHFLEQEPEMKMQSKIRTEQLIFNLILWKVLVDTVENFR